MSEPKHTPGPWHAVTIHPEGDSSGLALTYIRAIRDGHTEIAHVFPADILKRQAANARLIASAPELLEALEAYHTWMTADLDDVAEEYRRETGGFAPFKDYPAVSGPSQSAEARREAWDAWEKWKNERKAKLVEQARAAIAKARGGEG